MDRSSFVRRLARASELSHGFAKDFVLDVLPDAFKYFVRLNQSYDGNPLREGEVTFPDDVQKHGCCVGPVDADKVACLLWREGKVPEWIDISVWGTDQQNTYFELLCCGRFTAREDLLYYRWNNSKDLPVAPFGVKGPRYPPRLARAALKEQVVEKYCSSLSPGPTFHYEDRDDESARAGHPYNAGRNRGRRRPILARAGNRRHRRLAVALRVRAARSGPIPSPPSRFAAAERRAAVREAERALSGQGRRLPLHRDRGDSASRPRRAACRPRLRAGRGSSHHGEGDRRSRDVPDGVNSCRSTRRRSGSTSILGASHRDRARGGAVRSSPAFPPGVRCFGCRPRVPILGSGLSVADGSFASVQCMATLASARRQSGARAILGAIEAWAARRAAPTSTCKPRPPTRPRSRSTGASAFASPADTMCGPSFETASHATPVAGRRSTLYVGR